LIHIGKFKYPPGYGDGILRMQTQESAVEIWTGQENLSLWNMKTEFSPFSVCVHDSRTTFVQYLLNLHTRKEINWLTLSESCKRKLIRKFPFLIFFLLILYLVLIHNRVCAKHGSTDWPELISQFYQAVERPLPHWIKQLFKPSITFYLFY
jgi:hypothetical protein